MLDALKIASDMSSKLERRLVTVDAQVAQPASLALTVWQLRDQAGRVSSLLLAQIQSGKPFTPEQTHQLDVSDGRVQQLLEILKIAAASPDSPITLRDGLAKIEANYIAPMKPLRDRVVASATTDGHYDLTAGEWRRQSAPMLQSIMLMRDAAIDEGHLVATEKHDRALRNLLVLIGLLVVATGITVVVIVGIGRRIITPLAGLTNIIGVFADGSRDFVVPYIERADEIGHMAKAIEVLRDNALDADARAVNEALEAKKRDERRIHIESVTNSFVNSIDTVVDGVAAAIDGLHAATDTLSDSTATTTRQSSIVSKSAEAASGNVQTVAAAAEELTNSIQEISRRVTETAAATDGAVREAESTNALVRGLAESAQRIGDVVNIITEIASQTNLLALNATIEAARAGEAGKGFAVVAGEVKNLATQTARATNDIQIQVTAIQSETERAVEAIGGIAATISTVNSFTMGIASAVEEQGAATQEIARNVQQAAAGTSEVSQSIIQVLDAARQTGEAANTLSILANRLSGESESLKKGVGSFVKEMKVR
jgi:methyl-accepting chemotaxis protein